ncbi:hypothetical protein C2857_003511 [Epichloe festucae Fl1]|uniref:Uncharacterized protein n=1 Tax=Epichloe festucae (strain Fl1) TaxID=877507 RepID=A0A7U3Q0J9_EPIFF|nr:hypothetical protein C2857_003511 [Epichloe festucae Fl1]
MRLIDVQPTANPVMKYNNGQSMSDMRAPHIHLAAASMPRDRPITIRDIEVLAANTRPTDETY